jgi:hypothetical protein
VGGGWQSCCFWPNVTWWEKSVRRCTFSRSRRKTCGIDCLSCQNEFFVNNKSPWCQRKWGACIWLCSSPVSPFSVSVEFGFSVYGSCFLSFFSVAFFPRFATKFDAVPLSDPSQNHIRSDIWLQAKDVKISMST